LTRFSFQVERVAHLVGFEFLGQQALHAGAVFGRQIDLAELHAFEQQAIGRQLGFELGLDRLLDLGAFVGEDLAHRVLGEHAVDHALHRRLHHLAGQIGRQVTRHLRHALGIHRVAHGEVDAERQTLHRLERRIAGDLAALQRAVDLITQRQRAHAVHAG
jgi:hypothetical protein